MAPAAASFFCPSQPKWAWAQQKFLGSCDTDGAVGTSPTISDVKQHLKLDFRMLGKACGCLRCALASLVVFRKPTLQLLRMAPESFRLQGLRRLQGLNLRDKFDQGSASEPTIPAPSSRGQRYSRREGWRVLQQHLHLHLSQGLDFWTLGLGLLQEDKRKRGTQMSCWWPTSGRHHLPHPVPIHLKARAKNSAVVLFAPQNPIFLELSFSWALEWLAMG